MNTVIDTLRFSERLQTSGFAAEQANALARALADEMGEQLATKEDIRKLGTSTKEDIRKLGTSTKEDIRKLGISTKEDIRKLETSTKEDIRKLETSTKEDIQRLEGEVKALHTRVDGLETRLNFLFALIGLLVALELIPVVRAFAG